MIDILLDCDGVLADFISAAIKRHKKDMSVDEWKVWNHHEEDWGMTDEEFWIPLKGEDFWYNLEFYPWSKELLNNLQRLGKVTIVTAPTKDPGCFSGKYRWLTEKLNINHDDIIIGRSKHLLANKYSILIDDNPRNIMEFVLRGGNGVTFPQPWSSTEFKNWKEVVYRVQKIKNNICDI